MTEPAPDVVRAAVELRARPTTYAISAGLLFVALPAILIVGFRGETRDTSTYIDLFNATRAFPANPVDYYETIGVEWGFGLLNWAVHAAGLGWRVLFLVVSTLTFGFLTRAANAVQLRLIDVAPFYLGSYFLTQQLMQMRQGVATAIAFYVVTECVTRGLRPRVVALSAVAVGFHSVAVLPIAAGVALWALSPRWPKGRVRAAAVLGVVACAFVLARVAMQGELLSTLQRLATYAADEAYSGSRGLASPANVRAFLVLVFVVYAKDRVLRPRAYDALLVLYAAHLGLRLGFYDFEILSGRLATALGFGEVLLLPMALGALIGSSQRRAVLAALFLITQTIATLSFQTPWLVDDYFTPIHSYRPPG
jgi:hypothetical protein